MKFFVGRPAHDDTVFYLYDWSKELIERAESKGFKVLDCSREKASKSNIEKMIVKQQPDLLLFNGHGSSTMVCGHKNEPLILEGANEELLKGKVVYARSCSTGASLGPSCIRNGTRAYIGHKEDFAFWIGDFKASRPLNDEFARPFMNASNQVVRSLLNGQSVGEANRSSVGVFDKEIERLQRSDAPPFAEHVLPLLVWDKINQIALGDENAKV